AGARVGPPVAFGGLVPRAFLDGLSRDDVLVDAPFAGRPAKDLVGRAGELTVHTRRQSVRPGIVGGGKEAGAEGLAGDLVEPPVLTLVLRHGPGPDPGGALSAGGERRAGSEGDEVGRRRRRRRGPSRGGRR